MKLFLMRHGEAEVNVINDKLRNLSADGKKACRLLGEWFSQCSFNIDLILLSPYLRTKQSMTAMNIFSSDKANIIVLDSLAPYMNAQLTAQEVLAYGNYYHANNILVISHMPLLGDLVCEYVRGVESPIFATSSVYGINIHDLEGEIFCSKGY